MHIIKQLVEKGYKVIFTARSKEKAMHVISKFPHSNLTFEIIKDIRSESEFDELFKNHSEITLVAHTASPVFHTKTDPENQVLIPAVEGVKNICKSINNHAPQVKHLVFTSAYAAIKDVYKEPSPDLYYTEKSWDPITWEYGISNSSKAYSASKTFAEKELWRFIDEEKPNFNATTVLPPLVFGELLQNVPSVDKINTSNYTMYERMYTKEATNAFDSWAMWVDVRNVADAHITALEKPEVSSGKRWFTVAGYCHPQHTLDVIHKYFPELKDKCIKGRSLTKEQVDEAMENYVSKYDNSRTNREAGLKYYSMEETYVDTIRSLLEHERSWNST